MEKRRPNPSFKLDWSEFLDLDFFSSFPIYAVTLGGLCVKIVDKNQRHQMTSCNSRISPKIWLLNLVLFSSMLSLSHGRLDPKFRVRAVNLGGWLVTEGWIKPSLFDGIPNKDFLVS